MQAVVPVAREVLSELDLDRVLRRVVEAARDVTGAQYAALGVMNASRTALDRFITSGIDDEGRSRIGSLPTGRGVLGELINKPEPLRLRDIGAHPRSFGFPLGHPAMKSFLGVPILIGTSAFGNLYLTDKIGADEFSEADQEAVELLAAFAALAIDHAQRFTDSEARREELQQTVDALDATLQISRALGGETNLDAILELVAKRGRALITARALVIEHRRADGLQIAAGAGELPDGVIGRELQLDQSVANTAIRTMMTQRLEDEPNRRRFERHGLGTLGLRADAGLVVPLVFRGQAYGAIVAVDRLESGPSFSERDRVLLESFAASAATAVATAQSVADERRRQRLAAAEEERRRWARELHDQTLQGLAAFRFRLASARRMGTLDALEAATAEVIGQVDSEIANLRALITDLRPAALDELGLAAAIDALAERAAERGLEVTAHVALDWESGTAAARLSSELEAAVYRITQEALTNAQKHGYARHATVDISEARGRLTVAVRDDGRGFDPTASTSGFGLMGIRERADLLGGRLSITSSPGQGAELCVVLPAEHHDRPEPAAQTTEPPAQAG